MNEDHRFPYRTIIAIISCFCIYHFATVAGRGYRSEELTILAKPIVEAMTAAHASYLECSYFDAVTFEIKGRSIRLPIEKDADRCPLGTRLFINKEGQVSIEGLFGVNLFDPKAIEDDFKSKSQAERRQQFEHLAGQVRAKLEEIEKAQAQWDEKERKRMEEVRAARATWDHK